jgi:hypothetical protein
MLKTEEEIKLQEKVFYPKNKNYRKRRVVWLHSRGLRWLRLVEEGFGSVV